MAPPKTSPRPLDGLRVIDLTSIIFGPLATQNLTEMGAEVIKVEAPGGDIFRHIEPMRSGGMSSVFMNSNRGKQSIVLDLKSDGGRDALMRLVETGDVFIHSMRGKAAERLGIGYDAIRAVKPEIVYCFACGYGSKGPNAEFPAYDDIIQAASGLASVTPLPDGTPQLVRSVAADKISALYLTNALMGAILTLKTTGQGQYVEVPMFESMVHFMMVEHLCAASFEPPVGPAGYKRVLSESRQVYRTKDSFAVMLPYTTAQWQRFFEVVGETELAAADWVNDAGARSKRIDELYSFIASVAPSRTTAEWVSELRRIEVPAAAVNSLDDLFEHPQSKASGIFEDYNHPSEGKLRGTRSPFRLNDDGPAPCAPLLGENTRDVLAGIGFSDSDIDTLISEGGAWQADSK